METPIHFCLRFEKVVDVEVWHSDGELFSVFDLNSSDLLGYLYPYIPGLEGDVLKVITCCVTNVAPVYALLSMCKIRIQAWFAVGLEVSQVRRFLPLIGRAIKFVAFNLRTEDV
ncbi:hypothetical protein L2E82_29854 [Cichorium intybus]|uniref:Uncharacterized protein n=1 Tax=Cichorium intybus TaxID=13427 RepID=A0ACB9CYX1_CICIN|nr:hypothetical protein L2E82_29854 [Cichorium intybus]